MTNPLHPVIDAWCQWCVQNNRFVDFKIWSTYTHPINIVMMVIDYYDVQKLKLEEPKQETVSWDGFPIKDPKIE